MSYIVVYQRVDGSSGLEECSDLDLAVVAAERLRNVDSVESPRIFKTEEIHFDFRPYYRVEVAAEPMSHTPAPIAPEVLPAPAPVPAPAPRSLDPWADVERPVAEVTPIHVAEPPVIEEDVADAADEEIVVDEGPESGQASNDRDETAVASADIFSAEHLPDPPPDLPEPPQDLAAAQDLADDVNEAVPPRRGLFGR